MKIGVDLDGTLADYQRTVCNFVTENHDKNCKFSQIQRDDCYDILGSNMITRALRLRKLYSQTDSLKKIGPVADSQKSIAKLKKSGHDLFVVTSRFVGFSKATKQWASEKYSNSFDKIVFSKILASYSYNFKANKYKKFGADLVIEDSARVAKKCSDLGIKVILLDFPWNQGFKAKGVTRVKNWNEALKLIG